MGIRPTASGTKTTELFIIVVVSQTTASETFATAATAAAAAAVCPADLQKCPFSSINSSPVAHTNETHDPRAHCVRPNQLTILVGKLYVESNKHSNHLGVKSSHATVTDDVWSSTKICIPTRSQRLHRDTVVSASLARKAPSWWQQQHHCPVEIPFSPHESSPESGRRIRGMLRVEILPAQCIPFRSPTNLFLPYLLKTMHRTGRHPPEEKDSPPTHPIRK